MNIQKKISEYIDGDREFVVATVVEAVGSSPARSGFRMIVDGDGFEGSVGGGALEYRAVDDARKQLSLRKNALKEYALGDIGMTCGGTAKIFYEYMPGGRNFYVFGGGHICKSVCPIAESLGFKVTVVDDRPEVANSESQPHAQNVICGDFEEVIEGLAIPDNSYALIVTNKHIHDRDVLEALCKRAGKFRYIGMIGSRTKVAICLRELSEAGVSDETIENIYTPVGLNIGGDSPAEIAVGIMAEIIAIDHGKEVPHMKSACRADSPRP